MKLYLAGPMRGVPQFNYPAFHAAAAKLRDQGHEVFNPAEKDIERHGEDFFADNPTGDPAVAEAKGFSLREALGIDLAWICAEAEGIALLPGWYHSKGAQAEYRTAEALGLRIINLEHDRSAE